jgi:hypothetical protein
MVLCRVGAHRLAFPAGQVVSVANGLEGPGLPSARTAFALPPAPGKALLAEGGLGLLVDALEVTPETGVLLPTPALFVNRLGGSLRGFTVVGDALWPVFSLDAFARYLTHSTEAR